VINIEYMKKKNQIIITIAFLSSCVFNLSAQSLKEIIDDSTGRYIFAQARDNDATAAIELAEDELASRVESYLGEKGITDYNHNWREWIKRIVNEKYGLTRAFLYLNVEDLKLGAIKMSETKRDYLGKSKSETKSDDASMNVADKSLKLADNRNLTKESEKKEDEKRKVKKKETTSSAKNEKVATEKVVKTSTENFKENSSEDVLPVIRETVNVYSMSEESVNTGSDVFMDVVNRVLKLKEPGLVSSELMRGKNLGLISVFGNSNSKYIPHAYIVVFSGSELDVYAPVDDDGNRLNMRSGVSTEGVSGKIIYWFLKKSK